MLFVALATERLNRWTDIQMWHRSLSGEARRYSRARVILLVDVVPGVRC